MCCFEDSLWVADEWVVYNCIYYKLQVRSMVRGVVVVFMSPTLCLGGVHEVKLNDVGLVTTCGFV